MLEGVGVEGDAVFPVGGLLVREGGEGDAPEGGQGEECVSCQRVFFDEGGEGCGEGDGESDVGDVGVAVGHGLSADLYDADDGEEGDDECCPAEEDGGVFFSCAPDCGGEGDEEDGGEGGFPEGECVFGVGVVGEHGMGDEEFSEVDGVGVDCVWDAFGEGEGGGGLDGLGAGLCPEGCDEVGDGEECEGDFIEEDGFSFCGIAPSLEGVDVEEDEEDWEGHEHGFCHEGAGVEEEGCGVGGFALAGGVGVVCDEGEECEEGAEDVFAFGEPCDGFDVHGVDDEEECDEEAEGSAFCVEEGGEVEEDAVEGVSEGVFEVEGAGVEVEEGGVEEV